jgi:hypothetical protein
MIRGQRHQWWGPAQQREAERRAALEHEATKILARDRRRYRQAAKPVAKANSLEPISRNGWIPLSDLQRALRERGSNE